MDKHGANPDRILTQLTEHGLTPAEWGGETEVCKISAKTGAGIDELLETVILTAEMEELKANPNRAGKGCVLEARLDKNRGPIATLLVQNGTLRQSDLIIAGTAVGRVRVMTNDKGAQVKEAGPSVPVEITGLAEVPSPGDEFSVVSDERMARQLVEQRKQKIKDDANKLNQKVTLESLFSKLQEGEMKELNLIVKADVQGSAEAVKASLEKLSNDEVRVRVIHAGVGAINESDILLASTSNAIVIGFNVRPNELAQAAAKRDKVDMRMYRVIYDAINEITDAMKGMLAPKFREAIIGHAEVRQTYKVSAIGTIAGCYVKDGKITRDASSAFCATISSSMKESLAPCSASRTRSRRSRPVTNAVCRSRSSTTLRKATFLNASLWSRSRSKDGMVSAGKSALANLIVYKEVLWLPTELAGSTRRSSGSWRS